MIRHRSANTGTDRYMRLEDWYALVRACRYQCMPFVVCAGLSLPEPLKNRKKGFQKTNKNIIYQQKANNVNEMKRLIRILIDCLKRSISIGLFSCGER